MSSWKQNKQKNANKRRVRMEKRRTRSWLSKIPKGLNGSLRAAMRRMEGVWR